MKLSEFGKVHRYEPSGALHGLLRVRAFTQDDAHIFCTEDQITDECITVTKLILDIYKDLGFNKVFLKYKTLALQLMQVEVYQQIWILNYQ